MGCQSAVFAVAGQKMNAMREFPMSQRNAKSRCRGTGRGHAGNNFDGETGLTQCDNLLATTTKDKGISSFQPHNMLAGLCARHEKLVDSSLAHDVIGAAFAHVNPSGATAGKVEDCVIDKPVI